MLIFFLFLGLALSAPVTCSREEIIGCFLDNMDTDNDGHITVQEVNFFMLHDPCNIRPPIVLGETLIGLCDKTGDGTLSVEDYDHPDSCANNGGYMRGACMLCRTCTQMKR